MIRVSQPVNHPPKHFETPLQGKIYAELAKLGINYLRVSCDPAITIEDCEAIAQRLQAPVVKTLFLANRQLTRFHLLTMPGHKPFVTKDFSKALGVSRVSFVSPEIMMEMLSTPVGGASPLSVFADVGGKIQSVIDSELFSMPEIVFPDTTTTNYLLAPATEIINRVLPAAGHIPVVANL